MNSVECEEALRDVFNRVIGYPQEEGTNLARAHSSLCTRFATHNSKLFRLLGVAIPELFSACHAMQEIVEETIHTKYRALSPDNPTCISKVGRRRKVNRATIQKTMTLPQQKRYPNATRFLSSIGQTRCRSKKRRRCSLIKMVRKPSCDA